MNLTHLHQRLREAGHAAAADAVSALQAQHEATKTDLHDACVRVGELEAANAHLKARVELLESQAAKLKADLEPKETT